MGRAVGSGIQAEGTARTKALRREPASVTGRIGKLASVTQTKCEEEMRSGSGRGRITQGLWATRRVWGFILRALGGHQTVLGGRMTGPDVFKRSLSCVESGLETVRERQQGDKRWAGSGKRP